MMDADPDYITPESESVAVEVYDDEFMLIDLETSSDIALGPVNKGKSDIWKDFGILRKGGRILQAVRDKVYCKICFANKTLQRYVNEYY